jgi:DNA-binding winged helix-turn-helix (wHTH) protein
VAVASSQTPDRIFRFGAFELFEREGELRKNGTRMRLQEQPFRVLVELAANAGKMVAREELQQKLWPADTFVDFDTGLNTAIRKLRQALNDNADEPRYIETLAGAGPALPEQPQPRMPHLCAFCKGGRRCGQEQEVCRWAQMQASGLRPCSSLATETYARVLEPAHDEPIVAMGLIR